MKTTCLTPLLVAFQVFTAAMLFTAPAFAAKANAPLSNPDFTKGGVIPADAKHDWTLGAAETTSLPPPMAETQPGEILFCERNAGRDYAGHYYANFGYDCGNENHRLYGADGGRLAIYSPKTGSVRTLLEDARGAIRDPQVHYDGTKVLFSYREGGLVLSAGAVADGALHCGPLHQLGRLSLSGDIARLHCRLRHPRVGTRPMGQQGRSYQPDPVRGDRPRAHGGRFPNAGTLGRDVRLPERCETPFHGLPDGQAGSHAISSQLA